MSDYKSWKERALVVKREVIKSHRQPLQWAETGIAGYENPLRRHSHARNHIRALTRGNLAPAPTNLTPPCHLASNYNSNPYDIIVVFI